MTNAQYQRKRRREPSLLRDLEIAIFRYARGQGTTVECTVRDVLTDLRHACDIHGLNFGELNSRAYQGYLEELEYAKEEL